MKLLTLVLTATLISPLSQAQDASDQENSGAVTGSVQVAPVAELNGKWTGALSVVNPALFIDFAFAHNLKPLNLSPQFVGVSVITRQGFGRTRISEAFGNQWLQLDQKNGQVLAIEDRGFTLSWGEAQLVGTYADEGKTLINTQIIFRGAVVAQGQSTGQIFEAPK